MAQTEALTKGAEAMMDSASTRDRIVRAADELFYHHGFEHTSFSDIADVVRISRGNFYYHFKTKDELLAAVIEARVADRRELIRRWEAQEQSPVDRILCYVRIVVANQQDIERYGCPLGTLTAELSKLGHASRVEATEVLTVFREWLREQFEALGRGADSDMLAMHVLAMSQGIATLSNTYKDRKFVEREVGRLADWVHEQARLPEATTGKHDPASRADGSMSQPPHTVGSSPKPVGA